MVLIAALLIHFSEPDYDDIFDILLVLGGLIGAMAMNVPTPKSSWPCCIAAFSTVFWATLA